MLSPAQARAFKLLGVSPNDDPAVIRQAWRDLVRTYHPDQNGNDVEAANERLAALNAAYDVVQDAALARAKRAKSEELTRLRMAAKERAEAERRAQALREEEARKTDAERRADLARQTRLARQAAQEKRASEANVPTAAEEAALADAHARAEARAAQQAKREAELRRWTSADLTAARDAKKTFSAATRLFRKTKEEPARSHGFA